MPEVALTGQHHGHAGLVSGSNDLGVAHRPPGLDDGTDARPGQHLEAVGKGKNASLAPAPPLARSPALLTAISAATTRDC